MCADRFGRHSGETIIELKRGCGGARRATRAIFTVKNTCFSRDLARVLHKDTVHRLFGGFRLFAVRSQGWRLVLGFLIAASLLLLTFFGPGARACAAEPWVRLSSSASDAHGAFTGRLSPDTPVNLAITLPLRNRAGLQTLLKRLYDPSDPLYGHYLTPQQFTDQFAPTEQQYAAVAAYAQSCGLQVAPHPNRLVLDIAGSAGTVEAAFAVHLNTYQKPNGQAFFAADDAPALPVSIAGLISSVQGLDGSACLQPNVLISDRHSGAYSSHARTNTVGHGVSGGLTPADLKNAYSSSAVSQDGTGQSVALFELDDYTDSEIRQYINRYYRGDPRLARITRVPVDGGPGGPS